MTHNLEECYRVCRNIVAMEDGKVIALGPKEDVFLKHPTVGAARLMGCKNLSESQAVSSDRIEAINWGCELHVRQPLQSAISHVGIRAHHLNITEEAGLVNSFPCWLARMNETPYKVSLYLCLKRPPKNPGDYQLQAEMYKEKFDLIKDRPFPWMVHLAPEKLF